MAPARVGAVRQLPLRSPAPVPTGTLLPGEAAALPEERTAGLARPIPELRTLAPGKDGASDRG